MTTFHADEENAATPINMTPPKKCISRPPRRNYSNTSTEGEMALASSTSTSNILTTSTSTSNILTGTIGNVCTERTRVRNHIAIESGWIPQVVPSPKRSRAAWISLLVDCPNAYQALLASLRHYCYISPMKENYHLQLEKNIEGSATATQPQVAFLPFWNRCGRKRDNRFKTDCDLNN